MTESLEKAVDELHALKKKQDEENKERERMSSFGVIGPYTSRTTKNNEASTDTKREEITGLKLTAARKIKWVELENKYTIIELGEFMIGLKVERDNTFLGMGIGPIYHSSYSNKIFVCGMAQLVAKYELKEQKAFDVEMHKIYQEVPKEFPMTPNKIKELDHLTSPDWAPEWINIKARFIYMEFYRITKHLNSDWHNESMKMIARAMNITITMLHYSWACQKWPTISRRGRALGTNKLPTGPERPSWTQHLDIDHMATYIAYQKLPGSQQYIPRIMMNTALHINKCSVFGWALE